MYHQRTFCWYPRKTSTSDSYLIKAQTKGKLEGFVEVWRIRFPSSWLYRKASPAAPAQSSQGGKCGLVLELLPFLEVLGASFVWQGGFAGDEGRMKEQPPTNTGSAKTSGWRRKTLPQELCWEWLCGQKLPMDLCFQQWKLEVLTPTCLRNLCNSLSLRTW